MVSHVPGDRIAIFQGAVAEANLALHVIANVDPDVFTVKKSPRSTDRQLDEASPWMLEGAMTMIGPGNDSIMTGTLLAPCVLGVGLFAASQGPGLTVERRFGSISILTNRSENTHVLHVDMPFPVHPQLGRLIVCRETS